MKLAQHQELASEIITAMQYSGVQSFILVVMNTKELEFYAKQISQYFLEVFIHTKRYEKSGQVFYLRLANGNELKILRHSTSQSIDVWTRGCYFHKWWATTELLPDETSVRLQLCTMPALDLASTLSEYVFNTERT